MGTPLRYVANLPMTENSLRNDCFGGLAILSPARRNAVREARTRSFAPLTLVGFAFVVTVIFSPTRNSSTVGCT